MLGPLVDLTLYITLRPNQFRSKPTLASVVQLTGARYRNETIYMKMR